MCSHNSSVHLVSHWNPSSIRPSKRSPILASCFPLISKSPFQPRSFGGPLVLAWMAFTFLISLTCHSLHSQTFPALWPFCVTLSKHHLNCTFDTAWRAFKMPSRWWRRCGRGGGGGWRCAGCAERGLCRGLSSRCGSSAVSHVWTVQFTWRSSSDVSGCSFLRRAPLVRHPAACMATPPLFGLSPLGLCSRKPFIT